MKFKSEKGFTVMDIAIAIVVLFIFVSIIAFLIYNYNSDMKAAELESKAAHHAIDEIENIKAAGITGVSDGITGPTEIGDTGFSKTIEIEDYKNMDANKNKENIRENIIKKVTVTISYTFKGEQSVTLSTIITKENV